MPFKRVFAAIDFSPSSDEALRQAHERASAPDVKLCVCHIVPNELRSNLLFPHLNRFAAESVPAEVDRAAEAVANRVIQVTGRASSEFEVNVDHGAPYAEILKAAESWNADLIIMGSHGMTSAAGVLLGGVTHKVIRHAHSAVLVSRARKSGGIVAGTDFSDPALPAIRTAVEESQRTGRPLTVVHSLDLPIPLLTHVPYGAPPPILSSEDDAELNRLARERLVEALRKFNATGETLVTVGPAAFALITAAEQSNADLLVVGTVGGTGFGRILLGSVAEKTASQAPCSVLVTRLHR
jgi:nucleotide-binding universal stress UspA family protein